MSLYQLIQRFLPGCMLKPSARRAGWIITAAGLAVLCIRPILLNWDHNNFSKDTAISDFYANVWDILPQDSALITPGGVFGYDAFYWQMVYGIRPDVVLPTLPTPDPDRETLKGRDTYATTRALQGNHGPGALPPGLLDGNLWEIPILLGEQPDVQTGKRQSLVLYLLTDTPPRLTADNPAYANTLNSVLGGASLSGIDIHPQSVESGGAVHIKLYWNLRPGQRPPRVEISLGDQNLAQYEVGFGNLARYHREVGIKPTDMIIDEFDLVIPSTVPAGDWDIKISTVDFLSQNTDTIRLTTLRVINESGNYEYWLKAADE